MRTFLVDNGSLRPASWINLCRVAAAVGERTGTRVEPASVLHSTRMEAGRVPAAWPRPTTWERATKAALAEGERRFQVLPFFFGPTGAITEYLPERKARLEARRGSFTVTFAPFLADPLEPPREGLAGLLAEQVRTVIAARGLGRVPVILVDHGSPRPEVTAVRDRLGPVLGSLLEGTASEVRVASMERREGPRYAFNEPLLEDALRDPSLPAGQVVVAMLFLSPGRHAGPGGDIATICRAAEAERPGLRTHRTPLVGEHPGIVELLARRLAATPAGS